MPPKLFPVDPFSAVDCLVKKWSKRQPCLSYTLFGRPDKQIETLRLTDPILLRLSVDREEKRVTHGEVLGKSDSGLEQL
ncbi:hypothetical protein N9F34_05060 [Alphaproteobacteria bacterium]|nr:hypothetical protein [Alphaproteobacteria bacterium]